MWNVTILRKIICFYILLRLVVEALENDNVQQILEDRWYATSKITVLKLMFWSLKRDQNIMDIVLGVPVLVF